MGGNGSDSGDHGDGQIPPKRGREHYLGRAAAAQRFYIVGQNLCENAEDEAKKDLEEISSRLGRSYKEWIEIKGIFEYAVRGYEMAFQKPEGSEEAEAIRSLIRFQLSNEFTRYYKNQAHRLAITNCLEKHHCLPVPGETPT